MGKLKTVQEIIEEAKRNEEEAKKLYGKQLNILAPGELPSAVGNKIRKTHFIAILFMIVPTLLTIILSSSLWFYIILGILIALYIEISSFGMFLSFYTGNALKLCGQITSVKSKGIFKKSNKIVQFIDDYNETYCVEVPYNDIGTEDTLITVYVNKNFAPQPSDDGLLITNYLYICYFKDTNATQENNNLTYEKIMKKNVK